MSLRSQIHHAIDDVAPPDPTLERRVKAFVLSDDPDRKRLVPRPQPRWVAPLGLVAAALVLALVAGLFIGGRFWSTQNAPPSTIGQADLKNLESRPLNYPLVAPGAPCPVAGPHLDPAIGMVIGDGPIFVINSDVYQNNDWGLWISLRFAANLPADPGLVLIRGRDLKSNAQVAFAKYPLAPTPMTAVGPVIGRSNVANHDVQMRSEAAVPAVNTWPPNLGVYPEVITLLGLQSGSSGCIGLQIDAKSFTENLVVQPGVPG